MNFFFCIDNPEFKCRLTLPKFKNEKNLDKNIELFSLTINNNSWNLSRPKYKSDNDFFYIDENNHVLNSIYFLAKKEEADKIIKNNIISNINNTTDTNPAFRANLEVENSSGGFSSYQSDYPFSMIKISSGILSPLSILLSKDAEKNIIYFKNIFFKPEINNCDYYIINYPNKKILEKGTVQTNRTNIINIKNEFIEENNYFFTTSIAGIPIYYYEKNNHISFEHTHPPHQYILSNDKYILVKNLKKKFYDIISEKNL